MRKWFRQSLALAVLSAIVLSLLLPPSLAAQEEDEFIQQLMEQMSVEDKIGQLFLVTFVGSDVGPESDIAQLIQEYRVGGVVLLAKNANFTNGEDTPRQVAKLTSLLAPDDDHHRNSAGDGHHAHHRHLPGRKYPALHCHRP